jgi:hypothetical protein
VRQHFAMQSPDPRRNDGNDMLCKRKGIDECKIGLYGAFRCHQFLYMAPDTYGQNYRESARDWAAKEIVLDF